MLAWLGCVFDIGEARGDRCGGDDHPVLETEYSRRFSHLVRIVELSIKRVRLCRTLSEDQPRLHHRPRPNQ